MLSIEIQSPGDVQREMARRFKARRLALNLTQEGLALRSGVSWGSLKRFERSGLISLGSLLSLAMALGCLADFDRICSDDVHTPAAKSLDALLRRRKPRRKGQLK